MNARPELLELEGVRKSFIILDLFRFFIPVTLLARIIHKRVGRNKRSDVPACVLTAERSTTMGSPCRVLGIVCLAGDLE